MTRRIVTVVLIGLLLGAVAWSADQDRDQIKDGDGVRDQQQGQGRVLPDGNDRPRHAPCVIAIN